MLDRADQHQVTGPATSRGGAQHGLVGGYSSTGAEGDLVGPGAEHPGDGLPGRVQQHSGAAALPVEPGRVGPAVVERGEQRGPRGRVQRGRRRVVEIGRHADDATPARRHAAPVSADPPGTLMARWTPRFRDRSS